MSLSDRPPARTGIEDWLRFSQHAGLVLTLGYLLLASVGIAFESLLLLDFHIAYLTYAQTGDFLMAAIEHPLVLSFTVASAALLWMLLRLIAALTRSVPGLARWEARYDTPTLRRLNARVVYPTFIAVYFLLFTVQYAAWEAGQIRVGNRRPVRVALDKGGINGSTRWLDGVVVSTTAQYVFLYQRSDTTMRIVPVGSIAEIVPARRRGAGWGFTVGPPPADTLVRPAALDSLAAPRVGVPGLR